MNEWLWRLHFENPFKRVTTKCYIAELGLGTEVAGIGIAGTAGLPLRSGCKCGGKLILMNQDQCYRASLGKGDLLAQNYMVPWAPTPVNGASQTSVKKVKPRRSDSFVLTGWALEVTTTLGLLLSIILASVSSNWHHNGCRWKRQLKRHCWEYRS